MRTGMIITAVAGPLSNLVLAFVTGGILVFLASRGHGGAEAGAGLADKGAMSLDLLLGRIFLMNIGLAIFNMLPIPPLDGSRLLPQSWQEKLARFSLIAFFLFIIVINFAGGLLSGPVYFIGGAIVRFWSIFF
jgi:Zn-dependent protease